MIISSDFSGGSVAAIASKSEAHRILICSALADAETVIEIPTLNQDITATVRCLEALGAVVRFEQGLAYVTPIAQVTKNAVLDCGESGSTLRFMLPVAAALGADCTFVGHGKLPQRPMKPLTDQLRLHGTGCSADLLPITISGKMSGGDFTLPGDISSQYFTGLLLALPICGGGMVQASTPLQSKSYVDITLSVMRDFGAAVTDDYAVPGSSYKSPLCFSVGGDWSNAAFWLCAGALNQKVTVAGLRKSSTQGDKAVAEILSRFGAEISFGADSVTACPAPLKAIELDCSDIPDLVPVLSVVACAADGVTHFTGVGRLRIKESDRLAAIEENLTALGGSVKCGEDELWVEGKALAGGQVSGHNDHRMVMSAAVAALICTNPVTVSGHEAVNKSYPHFFEDLKLLGGKCHV